mmetsp:Transcript_13597/g.29359  ORF Transcript_13597/g.29359 Transcript_13597/m.29359 type:complete len:211 (-) Transcript_13597:516-1148(-)
MCGCILEPLPKRKVLFVVSLVLSVSRHVHWHIDEPIVQRVRDTGDRENPEKDLSGGRGVTEMRLVKFVKHVASCGGHHGVGEAVDKHLHSRPELVGGRHIVITDHLGEDVGDEGEPRGYLDECGGAGDVDVDLTKRESTLIDPSELPDTGEETIDQNTIERYIPKHEALQIKGGKHRTPGAVHYPWDGQPLHGASVSRRSGSHTTPLRAQ